METEKSNNSSYLPSRVKGILFSGLVWSFLLTTDKFACIQRSLLALSGVAFVILCWSISKNGGVSEDGLKESRKSVEYYLSAILVLIGAGIGVAIIDFRSNEFTWMVSNTIILLLIGIVEIYANMRGEE